MWLGNGKVEASTPIRSPNSAIGSIHSSQNLGSPHDAQKPHVSPPTLGNQRQSPVNSAHALTHQSFQPVRPYADVHRTKTPSPPKAAHHIATKRARSPLHSTEALEMASDIESEREKQAKAKRLARFHVELSRPIENAPGSRKHNTVSNNQNRRSLQEMNEVEQAQGANRGTLPDSEVSESSAVVVGLCPDMCPEAEREERERKGDLDKYERLDGERNQTTKFLAVKKYNRTAEGEADLIRPLPVLQRTVDYLLSLLDQPYDDNFLSRYNFLWDRMRAVRMDLRMQHIFNREAIAMLEQMIRLHIIVMHELCEYNKGEGFSEGFDAHLNIEQMNKTSVELFQMYDDHRKQGIVVPTEKEFRGYYALLKLDKHPGYKVEPAELSLDLAKMSPELRCSPEVSFAREVARACRISNYISFFRLARKASYLQACLIHAHFAKLRTQALASLHSGLQNNQGIPIKQVVKWLGMEGEDIGSLLEYHGFVLKKYEELYLVKEGLFLNNDSDFPTKCSQLVHLKKSQRIIDDVYSGPATSEFTGKRKIISDVVDVSDHKKSVPITEVWSNVLDEQMLDNQEGSDLIIAHSQPQQHLKEVPRAIAVADVFYPLSVATVISADDSVCSHEEQPEYGEVVESFNDTSMNQRVLPNLEVNLDQAGPSGSSNSECTYEDSSSRMDVVSNDGTSIVVVNKENELAGEKLKLILRKWKQRAAEKRSMREQKDFLATAALGSLTLGPPVRQNASLIKAPKHSPGELNIDYIAKERYVRQGKSWSRVDISELVAPIICERNPDAKCVCWKLLILVQPSITEGQTNHLASKWLLSKITGPAKEQNEPLVSSSHLSIWNKWIYSQTSPSKTCLSVIRDTMFDNVQQVPDKDSISGASCIMFLVSECIPWEIQRVRLHNLVTCLPSGSSLPLLIASSDAYMKEDPDAPLNIINRLGLHDTDKTKINTLSVVFLVGNNPDDHQSDFFDDNKLREGLQWLAYHSPLQPVLTQVKTRNLVLNYLRSALSVLDNSTFEVGPNNCISAFNEALDWLIEGILAAASRNPNSWPAAEIDLLEKSSVERTNAEMFLPSSDWSSHMKIEPLITAIRSCRLPSFHNDISWLKHGSHMGKQIKSQKLALEECLISYMRQSSLLNSGLAANEARLMVQKGVGLELRGSHYYIIPRWVTIFRRIYNWRLSKLTAGEFSVAYVLEQHLFRTSVKELTCRADVTAPSTFNSVRMDWDNGPSYEGHQLINPASDNISFDEVVEISCSLPSVQYSSLALMPEPLPSMGVFEERCPEDIYGIANVENSNNSNFAEDVPPTINRNDQMMTPLFQKNDRLISLLRQCSQLQDRIDEKLAIYF